MENFRKDQQYADYTVVSSGARTGAKTFMANVFLWMFLALGLSALFAYLFSSSPYLMSYLVAPTARGYGLTGLGLVVQFAPLAFVLLMSFGFARLSFPAIMGLFFTYAAINGISFSFILSFYTAGSVVGCFAAASLMFGVMAALGYTTNQDLTSFGRILFMGLIGIIIASLINMFMRSAMLDYIVSFIGIMVFTGLAAYDVQKLKRIGEGVEYEGVSANDTKKLSVLGALNLYLDFINLFLMLLRFFGNRRD